MADFADRVAARTARSGAVNQVLQRVKAELKSLLDPGLYDHMVNPVSTLYADIKPKGRMVEEEVSPRELISGMVLARDLVSGTGLLLLSAGVELDRSKIGLIRRFYLLAPPKGLIYIYAG